MLRSYTCDASFRPYSSELSPSISRTASSWLARMLFTSTSAMRGKMPCLSSWAGCWQLLVKAIIFFMHSSLLFWKSPQQTSLASHPSSLRSMGKYPPSSSQKREESTRLIPSFFPDITISSMLMSSSRGEIFEFSCRSCISSTISLMHLPTFLLLRINCATSCTALVAALSLASWACCIFWAVLRLLMNCSMISLYLCSFLPNSMLMAMICWLCYLYTSCIFYQKSLCSLLARASLACLSRYSSSCNALAVLSLLSFWVLRQCCCMFLMSLCSSLSSVSSQWYCLSLRWFLRDCLMYSMYLSTLSQSRLGSRSMEATELWCLLEDTEDRFDGYIPMNIITISHNRMHI